ncbi:MAG: hypothetical protein AAGA33_08720 [Pseudomonadota bacterium]
MPLLLLTFIDIALLRKGPEDIPRSSLFLVVASAFWFFVTLLNWALIASFTTFDIAVAVASVLFSLLAYGLFIAARGRQSRMAQCFTAILGATSCVSLVIVLLVVAFPLDSAPLMVSLGLLLLWFWTVQIEGHIIARTTDINLMSGVAIAAFVFVVQFLFTDFMNVLQQTPTT